MLIVLETRLCASYCGYLNILNDFFSVIKIEPIGLSLEFLTMEQSGGFASLKCSKIPKGA